MKRKIRLLIIEAHVAVSRALEVRLGSSPDIEVVATVGHLNQAKSVARTIRPDVILLGLKGSHNGEMRATLRLATELLQQGHNVVVLTSYADDVERELMLRAGIRRYLLKDINTDQLISEIKAVAIEAAARQ
ncbi:MAG TPA: response regulator [Anaerolineae bacterium]